MSFDCSEAWQEKFRELESFKEEHGHVQIPEKYSPNQELSTWLTGQRYNSLSERSSTKLKCATTRERRRNQLQSLGVTFPDESETAVEKAEQDWQAKFSVLESFKAEHGHVRVPVKYPQNQPFSTWLHTQRFVSLNERSPQKLKCATTRKQRRNQLQSLGVPFPDEDAPEQDWQAKFGELEQYKEDHGDVLIPQKYPQNQKLSTWLRNQRYDKLNENSSWKIKCATTRAQRREQLRTLGVTFPFEQLSLQRRSAGTQEDIWQEKFRQLERFKKKHGHLWVPRKYPQNQELSNWLMTQRYFSLNKNSAQKLKCAATRERRRQQLQSLGATFPDEDAPPSVENSEQDWQDKFRELQQFKKDHGHVLVPVKYPSNQKLSNWLRRQRFNSLSEDSPGKIKCDATRNQRRRKLMSLGVAFTRQRRPKQRRAPGSTTSIEDASSPEAGAYRYGHVIVPVVNSSLHLRKRTAPDDDSSSTDSKKMRIDVFEC